MTHGGVPPQRKKINRIFKYFSTPTALTATVFLLKSLLLGSILFIRADSHKLFNFFQAYFLNLFHPSSLFCLMFSLFFFIFLLYFSYISLYFFCIFSFPSPFLPPLPPSLLPCPMFSLLFFIFLLYFFNIFRKIRAGRKPESKNI